MNAVAAERRCAIGVAQGRFTPVVARLFGIQHAIPAEANRPSGGATVGVADFAISVAISAHLSQSIAIVTGLSGGEVERPISADRDGAVCVALRRWPTIVATLSRGDVDHSIATDRRRAVQVAGSRLTPVVAALHAGKHEPVPAARELAGRGASIRVTLIAIITGLGAVDDAVAAARRDTGAALANSALAIIPRATEEARTARWAGAPAVHVGFISILDSVHAGRSETQPSRADKALTVGPDQAESTHLAPTTVTTTVEVALVAISKAILAGGLLADIIETQPAPAVRRSETSGSMGTGSALAATI